MGEDPVNHQLKGGLLLEDDAGQVQQHLVPLHLELAALIQLCVTQPNAAELQVLFKYL